MTMTNEWNAASNLLCVQLGSPGDVLMCTPALRALRAQCPGRRVSLLASPAGATLGPYLPDADAVLAHEAPWTKNGATASHLDWIAGLAAQRFDGAVIFTGYRESSLPAALLCQLAGIPLRAAWCRETPHQLLTHWIADPEPGAMLRHPVQRQPRPGAPPRRRACRQAPGLSPASQDMTTVRTRLRAAGIDPAARWLALHPGAGAQARRYPQHHWRTLVQALAERIGCPLVLIGAGHEQALIDAIELPPAAHVHSLVGQLGIGELGALLAQASLLVSSNPGTVQLAAAVGTPLVELGTPADAGHAPWRVPSRMLGQHVDAGSGLEKLAPAQVVDAVCSLLKQTEACRAQSLSR